MKHRCHAILSKIGSHCKVAQMQKVKFVAILAGYDFDSESVGVRAVCRDVKSQLGNEPRMRNAIHHAAYSRHVVPPRAAPALASPDRFAPACAIG